MLGFESSEGANHDDGASAAALLQVWRGSIDEIDEAKNIGLEALFPMIDGRFSELGAS
jgi:hypothetical protein